MLLIKIGGGETINLAGIAHDLACVETPKVIVHGANALRDDLAQTPGGREAGADVGFGLHQRVFRRRS